ncbi:hypothetical protein LPB140_09660 [Sphingorhabdus lutea]|uniref:site-specific DNA-methyltransferase (adenine-specific) n=1 Tax=Sphingorhabdus lutea TaxID=1913578 RepID=A0A1L3JFD3_9SPHN|nr:Dam family site-specific DNA-(adenine-N6)-methyltransferase [Sphingorhabdus lutea]APG63763.1 hypothetical protein LPB140_09660 [Sphingorhabdus lutea]
MNQIVNNIGRKPFLKWAGNKHRVISHILPVLPSGERLVEPFAGSCAISLVSTYPNFLLSDTNADLIDLFINIQTDADLILKETENLFDGSNNNADAFYELREEFNSSPNSIRKSSIFIYLNRHCFNGLCRYNKSGIFNVPFGKYTNPKCPKNEIMNFASFAKEATFYHQSFEDTFAQARPGDVFYCDPPYSPLTATSNFTSYSKNEFGEAEHVKLRDEAIRLSEQGTTVIISNHRTEETLKLYKEAKIIEFNVSRLISSKASTRNAAPELLAIFDAR